MEQSESRSTILRRYRLLSSDRTDLVNGIVYSNCSLTTRIFPLLQLSLVEHLLNTSNMVVGFDGKHLYDSMNDQINQMDRAALGELLDAIAQRMAKEKSREQG
jgi:hypothetical protein